LVSTCQVTTPSANYITPHRGWRIAQAPCTSCASATLVQHYFLWGELTDVIATHLICRPRPARAVRAAELTMVAAGLGSSAMACGAAGVSFHAHSGLCRRCRPGLTMQPDVLLVRLPLHPRATVTPHLVLVYHRRQARVCSGVLPGSRLPGKDIARQPLASCVCEYRQRVQTPATGPDPPPCGPRALGSPAATPSTGRPSCSARRQHAHVHVARSRTMQPRCTICRPPGGFAIAAGWEQPCGVPLPGRLGRLAQGVPIDGLGQFGLVCTRATTTTPPLVAFVVVALSPRRFLPRPFRGGARGAVFRGPSKNNYAPALPPGPRRIQR
jgi:hypothetical protein